MKRKKEPQLIMQFFQPDASEKRWISYDISNLKIEVMFIDQVWMAAGTIDDEYNYFYGREISEIAPNRLVAITALLSQTGIPSIIELSSDLELSIYNLYPDIVFHWQDKATGQFEKEQILPKRNILNLTFHQRSDGQSWIWQNKMCKLEVSLVDSVWIATCDPMVKESETVKRPRLIAEARERNFAVTQLLKNKNIMAALGMSFGQNISFNEIFSGIKIIWKEQIPRKVTNKEGSPLQKSLNSNLCSWRNNTKECDGSFNCSFCTSFGNAYFMRWDD